MFPMKNVDGRFLQDWFKDEVLYRSLRVWHKETWMRVPPMSTDGLAVCIAHWRDTHGSE